MKRIIYILLGLVLCACGSNDSFSISGTVEGKPNGNLYIKYYGDGRVLSGVTRVAEGDFEISGRSRKPALVELADNEGRPLAYLYIKNGQQASVKIDRASAFRAQASGSPIIEEWSALSRSLADSLDAGTPEQINSIVERHVSAHPSSIASTILFLTAYHAEVCPEHADSVARMLEPEARPGGLLDSYATLTARYASGSYMAPIDSIAFRPFANRIMQQFKPSGHKATLMAITDNDQNQRLERADVVVPVLRRLHDENNDLYVFELSVAADTNNWKAAIRTDSAKWMQGWAPGGIYARGIDHMAIPALPYYIALDSAGRQAYRGCSLSEAAEAAKSLLKKK